MDESVQEVGLFEQSAHDVLPVLQELPLRLQLQVLVRNLQHATLFQPEHLEGHAERLEGVVADAHSRYLAIAWLVVGKAVEPRRKNLFLQQQKGLLGRHSQDHVSRQVQLRPHKLPGRVAAELLVRQPVPVQFAGVRKNADLGVKLLPHLLVLPLLPGLLKGLADRTVQGLDPVLAGLGVDLVEQRRAQRPLQVDPQVRVRVQHEQEDRLLRLAKHLRLRKGRLLPELGVLPLHELAVVDVLLAGRLFERGGLVEQVEGEQPRHEHVREEPAFEGALLVFGRKVVLTVVLGLEGQFERAESELRGQVVVEDQHLQPLPHEERVDVEVGEHQPLTMQTLEGQEEALRESESFLGLDGVDEGAQLAVLGQFEDHVLDLLVLGALPLVDGLPVLEQFGHAAGPGRERVETEVVRQVGLEQLDVDRVLRLQPQFQHDVLAVRADRLLVLDEGVATLLPQALEHLEGEQGRVLALMLLGHQLSLSSLGLTVLPTHPVAPQLLDPLAVPARHVHEGRLGAPRGALLVVVGQSVVLRLQLLPHVFKPLPHLGPAARLLLPIHPRLHLVLSLSLRLAKNSFLQFASTRLAFQDLLDALVLLSALVQHPAQVLVALPSALCQPRKFVQSVFTDHEARLQLLQLV